MWVKQSDAGFPFLQHKHSKTSASAEMNCSLYEIFSKIPEELLQMSSELSFEHHTCLLFLLNPVALLNCTAAPLQDACECWSATQQAQKGMIREFILKRQHMDDVFLEWNSSSGMSSLNLGSLWPYTLLQYLQRWLFSCVGTCGRQTLTQMATRTFFTHSRTCWWTVTEHRCTWETLHYML